MPKARKFDVLIVYNGCSATSAEHGNRANFTPFTLGSRHESCNNAYSYFLENCRTHRLRAAFTTSSDIVGPGTCQSYWTFKDDKWHKHRSLCFSPLIFDKFSPKTTMGKKSRELLFSSKSIKSFNDPMLYKLFFDKQKTFDVLSDHTIPTLTLVSDTIENIGKTCNLLTTTLEEHPNADDFNCDIVMKDRFGAGGNHVYKFKSDQLTDMFAITSEYPHISFIVQPFAKFDKGYIHKDVPTSTDIRLIYLGDKIIESYLRTAKQDDFRCNEHQGGSLTYLPISKIPQKIIRKAKDIIAQLPSHHSLYSLDFIVSNSGNPYLLEGNTGPGLDWNLSVKKEEINAKKFIRRIVEELSFRTSLSLA